MTPEPSEWDSRMRMLRAEAEDLKDRDLLLEILLGQRMTENRLEQFSTEIYGNADRGVKGIRALVDKHEAEIERARVRFQTVMWVIGLVGITNLGGWLLLWGRIHLGG